MSKLLVAICFLILSLNQALDALPARIIIIRHAEKPPEGNELNRKGHERAAALAPFILGTPELVQGGGLAGIFAMLPSMGDASIRPIQTVTPLSKMMGMKLNTEFRHKQYPLMAQLIKVDPSYSGKTVLICWEHRLIPEIARSLGAISAPNKWEDTVFDRIWVIDYTANGTVTFSDFPQRLMFGDSPN